MSDLLNVTADYNEGGSWGRMSNDFPEIVGDEAYDMYVFANCTFAVPYGSYVLMSQRGHYGATQSMLRVHPRYLEQLKAAFEAAGRPDPQTSITNREETHG